MGCGIPNSCAVAEDSTAGALQDMNRGKIDYSLGRFPSPDIAPSGFECQIAVGAEPDTSFSALCAEYTGNSSSERSTSPYFGGAS